MENRPDATSSIERFAVASARMRKMPSRMSGERPRCSMAMNAARSAMATAPRPSVRADPQPKSCALTIA
jgi:hypothetical protein